MLLSALLLLLLAAGRCSSRPRTRTEMEGPAGPGPGPGPGSGPGPGARSPDRVTRSQPGLEGHHKDPRVKQMYIRHLTGPLYFNPKCRKHFYRLYHGTRDCTVPAYYKRCARLLTRLANNPRCTER